MSSLPSVVSHRNHFTSVVDLVNSGLRGLPPEQQTEEMRQFLTRFSEHAIQWMSDAFKTGAERGIDQVARLLCDPDYYLTLKERRKKERERYAQHEERQKQERLERELCPSAEQVEKMRADLTTYIAEAERDVKRWRIKLASLPANPKHVRMPLRKQ